MAKKKVSQPAEDGIGAPKKARASGSAALSRLSFLAALFLIVEIAVIVVMGWDDFKRENTLEIKRLRSEVQRVEEAFTGARSRFDSTLGMSAAYGVNTRAVESQLRGAERVFRISPSGERASLADQATRAMASQMFERGETIGVTERNLVVLASAGQQTYAASFPLHAIIPDLAQNEALQIRSKTPNAVIASFGSSRILNTMESGLFGFGGGFDQAWNRHTNYCDSMPGTTLEICRVSARPWFTVIGSASVIAYSMLFLAPVLAVITLLGFIRENVSRISNIRNEHKQRMAAQHFDISSSNLHALSQQIETSFWEVDKAFAEIRFSGQLAKYLHISPGKGVPLESLVTVFGEDTAKRFVIALKKSMEDGHLKGVIGLDSGHGRRFVEFRGYAPPHARDVAMCGIAIDVTDRRHLEERMRMSEARLRNALSGFILPVALWDERKRLIFWNSAFEQAFDFDEGKLRPGMAYDHVNMELNRGVRIDRSTDSAHGERELLLRDGRWFSLAERATTSGLMLTVCNDISALKMQQDEHLRNEKKLKRLVSELERSEGKASELTRKYAEEKTKAEHASKAKGSFLANMSHELRTPLNAINGFSEMLVKEVFGPLGDERYHSYAQDILVSGQHLLDMINDILDMAKIESGKMTINTKPIDPIDPVDAAIRMIRRKADEKDLKLELVHNDDVREIEADHRAVRQMVLNLVSNAIKFTQADGRVTVQVYNAGDGVAIAVQDTGVGIAEEDLPRLANPFEQVEANQDMNPNGTGLGLALTRSLAEMHGGRFQIDSEVGVGTTVTLFLPAQQPDETDRIEAA